MTFPPPGETPALVCLCGERRRLGEGEAVWSLAAPGHFFCMKFDKSRSLPPPTATSPSHHWNSVVGTGVAHHWERTSSAVSPCMQIQVHRGCWLSAPPACLFNKGAERCFELHCIIILPVTYVLTVILCHPPTVIPQVVDKASRCYHFVRQ